MTSHFRLGLFSLSLLMGSGVIPGVTSAAAPVSNVGTGSIEERLTTLERISNAQSSLLTQIQQQIADNQRDIDMLRGSIQENQYQLEQTVERQKQLYQQLNNANPSESNNKVAGEAAVSAGNAVPTGETASHAAATDGDGSSDYNSAVSLVLDKKENEQAIIAFQKFIKRYPKSVYQPNANYWLGQLLYNKDKKEDASYYFAIVVKNYPKSPKAPDAMYKVGIIVQEKGEKEKAKAVFQQVIKQYPESGAAKQAQKRLAG